MTGWQRSVGNGSKWEPDPTLVCSSKLTSVCSEVFVELRGAAKEKHPECGGRYLPVKGKHNRGRWVSVCQHHLFGSNRKLNFHQSYIFCMTNIASTDGTRCLQVLQNTSSKEERYLRVCTGKTSWSISPTIDGEGSFIASGSAGSTCPAQVSNGISRRLDWTSWRYADNGWHNGDIIVTCKTHASK